jgi:hypothetical protein
MDRAISMALISLILEAVLSRHLAVAQHIITA